MSSSPDEVNPFPNDPVHEDIDPQAGSKLIYRAASGLERALADIDGQRLTAIYAELVEEQWDPYKISARNLPWLAWAVGVNLWEDNWSEEFKRYWIANQWTMKAQRGSLPGLKAFVRAVNGEVQRVIRPPARAYALRADTNAERAAYVARFPQLRLYPYVERSRQRWQCYTGRTAMSAVGTLVATEQPDIASFSGYLDTMRLLLHFDGNFNDATKRHILTPNGSAVIDYTQSKFGSGSARFYETPTGYLAVANNVADFSLEGDFTIDFQLRIPSGRTVPGTIIDFAGYYQPWSLRLVVVSNNYFNLYLPDGGGNIITYTFPVLSEYQWYHIAVVRRNGIIKVFYDGVQQFYSPWVAKDIENNVPITVGDWAPTIGVDGTTRVDWRLAGWLDELRLLKFAAWTTDFPPPTESYGGGGGAPPPPPPVGNGIPVGLLLALTKAT